MKTGALVFFLFGLAGCERISLTNRQKNTETLQIVVAFGYKDARPARFVGDRYEKIYFVQELTKPCSEKSAYACGFSRNPKDAEILKKDVSVPDRGILKLRLKITSSSAGPDDDQNQRDPFQEFLSDRAEMNFQEGLSNADAVFYIGHSRDGGGPDFELPKLGRFKHPDYQWYRRTKPGLNTMLKALGQRERQKPLLFSLLSCNSSEHFRSQTLSKSPFLNLQTVDGLIYYSDSLKRGLSEISDLIQKKLATAPAGTST